MDWDKLRIFHAVAEAGSFTHAGEALSLSQSAVSRQISALEESLTVPLFHRHARGLLLTEQGEVLYDTVREVFSKLAMTEAMLSDSKDRPRGPLKVTATYAFGTFWLAPRLRQFIEQYPDIQMTMVLDDNELDLAMRQADVAIRLLPPKQPDLVQRHLISMGFHLYAHRDYVARHGAPKTQEDLANHKLIVYPEGVTMPVGTINWLLTLIVEQKKTAPILRVNTLSAIKQSIESGLGIGALPDYLTENSPDLVRVLPDLHGPKIDAWFVYAEELRHSKRIAVFRDFLVESIAKSRF